MTRTEREAAWSGDAEPASTASSPNRRPTFPASLLADPAVCFMAGHRGAALLAGGIFNRSASAVGLSNVFAVAGHEGAAWAGLVRHAASTWAHVPLVGWESGAGLAAAAANGLVAIGPLRVWLRR